MPNIHTYIHTETHTCTYLQQRPLGGVVLPALHHRRPPRTHVVLHLQMERKMEGRKPSDTMRYTHICGSTSDVTDVTYIRKVRGNFNSIPTPRTHDVIHDVIHNVIHQTPK